MGINIVDDIPFKIDRESIIEKLAPDGDEAERVGELVDEAQAIGKPKGIFRLAYIESKGDDFVIADGVKLTSRILRVNLENAHKIVVYALTCGTELENWSHTISDMIEQYWADTIKEKVLGLATGPFFERIKDCYALGHTGKMNPGSLEDWPISEQKGVFTLLGDTESSIGLTLTDSFLMLPVKSISGIIFPTEANYENCQLCPREACPGRRAPYDSELYNRKYRKEG